MPRRPPATTRSAVPLASAAIAAATLAASSSCAPVYITAGLSVAQVGTAAFNNGQLLSARQARLDEAWAAAVGALEELEFDIRTLRPPGDPEGNGRSAYVMAQDQGGPAVKIKLESASEAVTRIRIRINIFGDQALARLVLSRIDARLPTSTAPPPPFPFDPPRP